MNMKLALPLYFICLVLSVTAQAQVPGLSGLVKGISSYFSGTPTAAPAAECEVQIPDNLTDATFNRTEQHWVDQIYDTLEVVNDVFRKNNIKYSMIGGTLLGAHRHGGIIPWDDDGDLAILEQDMERVGQLKEEFAKRGYGLRWWPGGLQVYPKMDTYLDKALDYLPYGDSLAVALHGNTVPFVDIFPIKEREPGKLKYATYFAHSNWPKEYFSAEHWQNRIVDVPFGHLTLKGLDKEASKEFLDRSYGSNWNDVAYRTFDHVNMKSPVKREVRIVDRGHAKHSTKGEAEN